VVEKESVPKIEDSYTYNGEGLRTSQTISGTTSYLSWDMTEELPLILCDTTNSYIYGLGGLPIEQISSGGTVGLVYLRARAYDPATAQFLTVDPLVQSTRALYMYAQDNPLNRADPTGLCTGFGPAPAGCTGGPGELGPHVFCEPTKHETEETHHEIEKAQEEKFKNEEEESKSKLTGQEAWGSGAAAGSSGGGEPKDAPPEDDGE